MRIFVTIIIQNKGSYISSKLDRSLKSNCMPNEATIIAIYRLTNLFENMNHEITNEPKNC